MCYLRTFCIYIKSYENMEIPCKHKVHVTKQ